MATLFLLRRPKSHVKIILLLIHSTWEYFGSDFLNITTIKPRCGNLVYGHTGVRKRLAARGDGHAVVFHENMSCYTARNKAKSCPVDKE
jgi:hypothetical protein